MFTSNGYVIRVGFDTVLYMVLCLGLNVVVGYAGLLDLGYVAFFGFGAYVYAMLSSPHFGLHWDTLFVVPIAVVLTGILGFLVALPSRRLIGDYLAIVTLFFGQLFYTVFQNGSRISLLGIGHHSWDVTGGPNGIVNIDNWDLGGLKIASLQAYYYTALIVFMVSLFAIYLVDISRTGRAWKSLREDPLAAELMGIPVNRLKLVAFAVSAGIGGLAGTLFAGLNTAVFAADFYTPTLIIVYAMLILGGAGSLGGVIIGAFVVNVSLEALRTPGHATWIFFVVILATLIAKVRPWKWLFIVVGGTIGLGYLLTAIANEWFPRWTAGPPTISGWLGTWLDQWVLHPSNPTPDRQHRLHPPRLRRARTDAAARLEALARDDPDALPRVLHVDQPARRRAEHHAPDPDRRDPHRPHERAAAGTARHRARGDRLMAEKLLELQNISKTFGGLTVIQSLDLHVDEGEIVSVIGPNGAGKTTLFNLVTGVYRPDSGDIRFEGESLLGLEAHQITGRGIARTFQTLRLFLNMTVKENVMAAAYSHTHAGILRSILRTPGMRREEKEIQKLAEERLSFFGQRLMGYRWDQPAYSLSYANRRRLEIARATATNPRLLLLDEPAAGMNPVETHEITELIARLREDGGYTILVIEHDMHVVEGISDRVIALDHGEKISEGTFEQVATDPRVVEAYLGTTATSTK